MDSSAFESVWRSCFKATIKYTFLYFYCKTLRRHQLLHNKALSTTHDHLATPWKPPTTSIATTFHPRNYAQHPSNHPKHLHNHLTTP